MRECVGSSAWQTRIRVDVDRPAQRSVGSRRAHDAARDSSSSMRTGDRVKGIVLGKAAGVSPCSPCPPRVLQRPTTARAAKALIHTCTSHTKPALQTTRTRRTHRAPLLRTRSLPTRAHTFASRGSVARITGEAHLAGERSTDPFILPVRIALRFTARASSGGVRPGSGS